MFLLAHEQFLHSSEESPLKAEVCGYEVLLSLAYPQTGFWTVAGVTFVPSCYPAYISLWLHNSHRFYNEFETLEMAQNVFIYISRSRPV